MPIKINDDYRIETDFYNVTLQARKVYQGDDPEKKGRETWAVVGHYPDYQAALVGMARHHINAATDFIRWVNRIIEMEATIRGLNLGDFRKYRGEFER